MFLACTVTDMFGWKVQLSYNLFVYWYCIVWIMEGSLFLHMLNVSSIWPDMCLLIYSTKEA